MKFNPLDAAKGTLPAASAPTKPPRRPRGRPLSTGNQAMPQVLLRLPEDTAARLRAWSAATSVPVWQLVNRAVVAALDALPAKDKKLLDAVTASRTQHD